jgi:hypothetical protein
VTFETTGGGTLVVSAPGATTRRVFTRGEQARALVQVYQGVQRSEPVQPVDVRVRIADAAGRSLRDEVIRLPEREFTDRRATVAVDLQGMSAGDHVLAFSASMADRTSERAGASRSDDATCVVIGDQESVRTTRRGRYSLSRGAASMSATGPHTLAG